MCNAWNHPPDCTCGWGGDGHLGRSAGGFQQPVSAPRAVLQSQFRVAASFTNPNANCPVCGASVFFYQSPTGGRVFFDDLGPPWPKHPCTDNRTPAGSNARSVIAAVAAVSATGERRPQWLDDGWSPFICADAQPSTGNAGYCRLVGRLGDALTVLYLCTVTLPDGALLQIRPVRQNDFDVSMAWIEEATNRVRRVTLKAFSTMLLAAEWCANEAKTGKPRLSRLVKTVVVKGNGARPPAAPSGRGAGKPGKARGEHGNVLTGGSLPPWAQDYRPPQAARKQGSPAARKVAPGQEKSAPRQPKAASGNQMAHAFAAARAKKTNR